MACEARAPHVIAVLVREATDWLAEHGPAAEAARRAGERDRPYPHSFGAG